MDGIRKEKRRQRDEFWALADPSSMVSWLADTLKRKGIGDAKPVGRT